MKILAIGNSFSEDATRYLQTIAKSVGEDMFVRNAYIGGCSLERHAANIKTGEMAYAYQIDATKIEDISIGDALTREEWDYVTVQQVSGKSGRPETYEPFMGELIAFIKEKAPKATIVFHRTWQYEKGSRHGDFPTYGCDREKMYECIVSATAEAAARYGIDIIGSGDAIHKAVMLDEFDPEKGGVSLYRDGFHLGGTYGRYLAALVWFSFFTGRSAEDVTFAPDGTDPALIKKLKELV